MADIPAHKDDLCRSVPRECVDHVLPVVDLCSQVGARGCSPRIVKAHGGARTTLSLEFGRCVDQSGSFCCGVSSVMFEHALSILAAYKSWTHVTHWQTIDEFTILCKLSSLGDSCVVMRNSYPCNRKKIHVEYTRRSVEREAVMISGQSTVVASCMEGRGGERMRPGFAPCSECIPLRCGVAAHVRQVARTTRNINTVQQQNSNSSGAAAAVSPCPEDDNDECALAERVGDRREETPSRAAAGNARNAPTITDASGRAATRTASVALHDNAPLDVRVRAVRDITIPSKSLKDLVEPVKSNLMITKTFIHGDAMQCDKPAWRYELSLNWCGRGITQAERRQRTQPPRCCLSASVANASEILMSGSMTAKQLTCLILQKTSELHSACLCSINAPRIFCTLLQERSQNGEPELIAPDLSPRIESQQQQPHNPLAKVPVVYCWVPLA